MSLSEIYRNEFTGINGDPGIGDLSLNLEGGTIVQDANLLKLTYTGVGFDGNWPFLSADKVIPAQAVLNPGKFETRLSLAQVFTGTATATGIRLSSSSINWKGLGFGDSSTPGAGLIVKGGLPGGVTTSAGITDFDVPIPHILQIFWVPLAYGSSFVFEDHGGLTVGSGKVTYAYSDDDGLSFTIFPSTVLHGTDFNTVSLYYNTITGFGHFDYISIAINVPIEVSQTDTTEITFTTPIPLKLTGSSLIAIEDPTSYTLTPQTDGVAANIVAVKSYTETTIILETTIMTKDEDYKFEIVKNILKENDESLLNTSKVFTSNTDLPIVESINVLTDTTIMVNFNREIFKNQDLLDPTKYVFTAVEPIGAPTLTVLNISRITPTSVLITTSTQDPNILYDLTVNP